jgi:hypothetical protein
MRFMNDWDIDRAARLYAGHKVLGPAVRQVAILQEYANANSDGWAYWPKPARAAAKLMELIERDGTNRYYGGPREDATLAELRKALVPVKALRTRLTRQGKPWFEVVDA